MMSEQLRLGARLKALRKQRGMTLQDAAAQAEISLSFLSDAERNRTLPSLTTLFSLARTYNTTASDILRNLKLQRRAADRSLPGKVKQL